MLAEIAILNQLPHLPIRLPISEDRLWMRPADDEVQGVGLITTDLPAWLRPHTQVPWAGRPRRAWCWNESVSTTHHKPPFRTAKVVAACFEGQLRRLLDQHAFATLRESAPKNLRRAAWCPDRPPAAGPGRRLKRARDRGAATPPRGHGVGFGRPSQLVRARRPRSGE